MLRVNAYRAGPGLATIPFSHALSRMAFKEQSGYMAVAFDEMSGPGGDLRPAYQELSRWLKETPPDALEYRRQEAELLFRRIGITFAVYGDAEAQERLIPFDVIPRIVSSKEWTLLEKGLKQRVRALNMFLRDIYHGRDILRANIVPDDLIFQNPVFRPEMNGQSVPHDVYVHIAGIDIRSEEHTSELQSRLHLVCRLLL